MSYFDFIQESLTNANINIDLSDRKVLIGGAVLVAGSALLVYQLTKSPAEDGLLPDDDEDTPSLQAIVRLKAGADFSTMAVRRVRNTNAILYLPSKQVRIRVKSVRANPAGMCILFLYLISYVSIAVRVR